MFDNIEFINPPVMPWVWTDHERKIKIVQVAVALIAGARNVDFEIFENGEKIAINYVWPQAIFKPIDLFEDEIRSVVEPISINHPKIHSLTTQLLSSGITEKSLSKGKIIIPLPIKIQREIGTWKKKAVKKSDGTRIVLLEFKGYQENTHIKEADTTISFD